LADIRGVAAPPDRFDPRARGIAEIGNPNDPNNAPPALADPDALPPKEESA
jgi:hypothetical protein